VAYSGLEQKCRFFSKKILVCVRVRAREEASSVIEKQVPFLCQREGIFEA